jgi:hypothetical protein
MFGELNSHLLRKVLYSSDAKTIQAASIVCKHWHSVAHEAIHFNPYMCLTIPDLEFNPLKYICSSSANTENKFDFAYNTTQNSLYIIPKNNCKKLYVYSFNSNSLTVSYGVKPPEKFVRISNDCKLIATVNDQTNTIKLYDTENLLDQRHFYDYWAASIHHLQLNPHIKFRDIKFCADNLIALLLHDNKEGFDTIKLYNILKKQFYHLPHLPIQVINDFDLFSSSFRNDALGNRKLFLSGTDNFYMYGLENSYSLPLSKFFPKYTISKNGETIALCGVKNLLQIQAKCFRVKSDSAVYFEIVNNLLFKICDTGTLDCFDLTTQTRCFTQNIGIGVNNGVFIFFREDINNYFLVTFDPRNPNKLIILSKYGYQL